MTLSEKLWSVNLLLLLRWLSTRRSFLYAIWARVNVAYDWWRLPTRPGQQQQQQQNNNNNSHSNRDIEQACQAQWWNKCVLPKPKNQTQAPKYSNWSASTTLPTSAQKKKENKKKKQWRTFCLGSLNWWQPNRICPNAKEFFTTIRFSLFPARSLPLSFSLSFFLFGVSVVVYQAETQHWYALMSFNYVKLSLRAFHLSLSIALYDCLLSSTKRYPSLIIKTLFKYICM